MSGKVKLFYSYSHEDEKFREELEKHLTLLRRDGIIYEWHDRKIGAGDDLDSEIDKHMESAHIILLLFSPDFIASESCDREVEKAVQLRNEKQVAVIPVILRFCAWDETQVHNFLAIPKDGKPITDWDNRDEAWKDVYGKIKAKVETISSQMGPEIKDEFINSILFNPLTNGKLNDHFVYPDMFKQSEDLDALEKEINSIKLNDLSSFGYQYIIIEGEEQSGKTSLCNMLYISFQEAGYYPVIFNGKEISGKANIKERMFKNYNLQYSHQNKYWFKDIEERILLIDDADEITAKNLPDFLSFVKDNFKYAIIFLDELSNLSDMSSELVNYSYFHQFSINRLGHRKRDELIKKCIAHDENADFDINNSDHLARLDKCTEYINAIIGANIVPSYPVFVVTIFNTVELTTPIDLSQTSYGHCYHAMVVMNLGRAGIKPEDIDAYFNFLTQLAYFIFCENSKTISEEKLAHFLDKYKKSFIISENIIINLERAGIFYKQSDHFRFQYVYVYYYFVARYIARELDNEDVKKHIEELMLNIHKKDNANIIIFITHHTRNKDFLDEITLNALDTFAKFSEATLSGDEKNLIKGLSESLEKHQFGDDIRRIEDKRNSALQTKDDLEPVKDDIENQMEQIDDPLLIEIRKSAKNLEIIGQILRNHYGSLERDRLEELFREGQLLGLRLLRSFIVFMQEEGDKVEDFFHSWLEEMKEGENLTLEEKRKLSQKIVSRYSYGVILGWLHKIINSLGYDKLIHVADVVNDEQDSVASNLINLSIHAWYTKKLDLNKIKQLYLKLQNENNMQAIYILKDIIVHYCYMHPVDYRNKQKISSLLGIPVKTQISVQQRLPKK